jgi:Helix-turn-helix domain
MHGSRTPRYCRCGTRLGRYRTGGLCGQCEKKLATLRATAPKLTAEFWDTPQLRDAFAAQHIGQVCRAYRKHPYHLAAYGKDGIPQEVVGGWLGLTQAQISRIETGAPVRHLDNLARWARTLRIPEHLLWFRLPPQQAAASVPGDDSVVAPSAGAGSHLRGSTT